MFTQPVSMYCIKEWYEKDLRQPLLDMGYEEYDIREWDEYPVIVTFDNLELVSNMGESSIRTYDRYFIDHYNPQFFLALAAMRKTKFSPTGEYFSVSRGEWVENTYFNFQEINASNCFRATEFWKKLTKEELIEKFTIMKKDLRELLVEGRMVVDDYGHIGAVVGGNIKMILWLDGGVSLISEINNELISPEWNICKIYQPNMEEFIEYLKEAKVTGLSNLIWSRKEQYTIDQLIEKAGLNKDKIEII